jgi:hypothetical protein
VEGPASRELCMQSVRSMLQLILKYLLRNGHAQLSRCRRNSPCLTRHLLATGMILMMCSRQLGSPELWLFVVKDVGLQASCLLWACCRDPCQAMLLQ